MPFRRVLIALDESAPAAHAFDVGIDLIQALGAEAALVHVVDPKLIIAPEGGIPGSELLADLKRTGQALLTVAAARVEGTREWNTELLIIGTHGRSGLTRVVMGEHRLGGAPTRPVSCGRGQATTGAVNGAPEV
jgi:nucleotide-binding universal stress UspA family protein